MQTLMLPAEANYTAPDGSLIRLLPNAKDGGLAHCTLPPSRITAVVAHRSVEEIWYVLKGAGQIWRKSPQRKEITPLAPGVALTIEPRTAFQFRSGSEELQILIATMPVWPGPQEAEPTTGCWTPTVGSG